MSHILSYEIDLELQLYATKQITAKQISYSQMRIISEESLRVQSDAIALVPWTVILRRVKKKSKLHFQCGPNFDH